MLLVCALGCAGERPVDRRAGPPDGLLTTDAAREAIAASAAFRLREFTVHILEWQLAENTGEPFSVIRREREASGLDRVSVEVLPTARHWLAGADYYAGGVLPLRLVAPITRRIVDIDTIEDADFPLMKEVRIRWNYVEPPEPLRRLKPELFGGPYPATVRLQYQEDSWRVVGHVRESRISL